MRLIDADALPVQEFLVVEDIYGKIGRYMVVHKAALDAAPTIEAEPVRHGRWLSYTGTHYTGKENEYGDPEYKEHIFFVCSNCRRKTVVQENFCPHCGAKMGGGADNG